MLFVTSVYTGTLPFEHFTKILSASEPVLTKDPTLGSPVGRKEVGLGLELPKQPTHKSLERQGRNEERAEHSIAGQSRTDAEDSEV